MDGDGDLWTNGWCGWQWSFALFYQWRWCSSMARFPSTTMPIILMYGTDAKPYPRMFWRWFIGFVDREQNNELNYLSTIKTKRNFWNGQIKYLLVNYLPQTDFNTFNNSIAPFIMMEKINLYWLWRRRLSLMNGRSFNGKWILLNANRGKYT